jgi:hypothetical protein
MGTKPMAVVDLFEKCEPASVVQTEKTQKTVYCCGPQAARAPDVREPSTGRVAITNGSLEYISLANLYIIAD